MNRGWTKILVSFLLIAALFTWLAWPRHMPPPEEKRRAESIQGMSMIMPPDWEAVQGKETGDFDDSLKLRPIADGRLQPSILIKRFTAPPDPNSPAPNAFKRSNVTPFQGKDVWFFEGMTKTEFLYRFEFESNARWYQITLSTPTPIEYRGSDWQQYLETFRAANTPATTGASTAPSTNTSGNR